jgi:hypothetical protein
MTKVFEDDLILEQDKSFNESIKVKGSIKKKESTYSSLTVKGDIDACNIDAGNIDAVNIDAGNIDAVNIDAEDIDAEDIDAGNIDAWNIDAEDIDAEDIDAWNIDAEDITYYAFCIARKSLKCSSIEGRRENSIHECLDNDIQFKDEKEVCDCCGQKIKGEASK